MNYGKSSIKRRARQIDRKPVKVRRKIGVVFGKILLICVLIIGVVGVSTVVGAVKGILASAPDISAVDVIPTGFSTTVLASDGIDLKGIARALVADLKSMDFTQGASTITQQLVKNNVLSEQWESENTGDISKIEKMERQVQRKIQEMYIAVELEKKVDDKDWILENYLNSINLGNNTLGVQAAAERYFGKDVSDLTLSECAVIAGITKNPSRYNPILYPKQNAKRRKMVLDAMKKQGYITQKQYDEAMADDVYDRISEHNSGFETSMNSYFVDSVIDDVFNDLVKVKGYSESDAYKAIYQGGLTIKSTQNLDIQKICDEEVANAGNYEVGTKYSFILSFQVKKADGSFKTYTNQTMLSYYKAKNKNQDYSINYSSEEACRDAIAKYEKDVLEKGDKLVDNSEYIFITAQPQVAMTIMDQSTGEVQAIVGGRGDKAGNRTWNRATKTTRQPGSTFKIIACYAPALDAGGMTLASVEDDAPFTVGSKTYNNYDHTYKGFTNLRTAITRSMNIVTVKTLQDIGVDLGYQYAEDFGFTTLDENDKNLGISLGGLTKGVTNLELTSAYAAIANQGEYIAPSFYTQVLDHDGNVILDNTKTKERHRVVKEETAWLLTDAMKDVMTAGTGTRAYFGSGMVQAGKSGTTTSNRDALFAGFTPYYTCVVWGGYDDNSKQMGGAGTSYPKNLWRSVMKRVHENLESKDFEKPKGITQATVCSKSGLLPKDGVCENDPRGSLKYTEYFASGTTPKEECNHHEVLSICKVSGEIAGPYCPKEDIQTKVFIVGAAQGSADYPYCASKEFLNKTCSVHDENYIPDEENPEEPSDEDPADGEIDEPQTPEEGEDTPADEPEELDPSLTAFGIWRWIMAFHR